MYCLTNQEAVNRMQPVRIGIVGVGKIARDQHIPRIGANPAFELAAIASRHGSVAGVANFRDLEEMLAGTPDLDAVAICTPPQTHYDMARQVLLAGRHVLMEKPPCASIAQLDHLVQLARDVGCSLYQTWHSQHARGVDPARLLLQKRRTRRVHITWKEDVLRWHPGQTWLWEPGGFGVFDPGMNALSILTKLIPEAIFARNARLFVPRNCGAPIAAELELASASGIAISAEFDFRETGPQRWTIEVDTDEGALQLTAGGGLLTVGNQPVPVDAGSLDTEYEDIYKRFAELVARKESDVDARPLQLVADIFLLARQIPVNAFEDPSARG
jgi:D-galactose 1-dehydrogenase